MRSWGGIACECQNPARFVNPRERPGAIYAIYAQPKSPNCQYTPDMRTPDIHQMCAHQIYTRYAQTRLPKLSGRIGHLKKPEKTPETGKAVILLVLK